MIVRVGDITVRTEDDAGMGSEETIAIEFDDRQPLDPDWEYAEFPVRCLPSLRAALNTPLTAREIEEEEERARRKTGDTQEENP